MARFDSVRDRRTHQMALHGSPPHHVIGAPERCQLDARVDFAAGEDGWVGALVTETPAGVRVAYYRSVRALKAAWIDTVHAHADCCLYAEAA